MPKITLLYASILHKIDFLSNHSHSHRNLQLFLSHTSAHRHHLQGLSFFLVISIFSDCLFITSFFHPFFWLQKKRVINFYVSIDYRLFTERINYGEWLHEVIRPENKVPENLIWKAFCHLPLFLLHFFFAAFHITCHWLRHNVFPKCKFFVTRMEIQHLSISCLKNHLVALITLETSIPLSKRKSVCYCDFRITAFDRFCLQTWLIYIIFTKLFISIFGVWCFLLSHDSTKFSIVLLAWLPERNVRYYCDAVVLRTDVHL